MRSALILFVYWLQAFSLPAQGDSTRLDAEARLPDAIYLRYDDLRHNNGIGKEEIISDEDKTQLGFIGRLLSAKTFSYSRHGVRYSGLSEKVWGYTQNNTLYINYQGEFYRVPVFGAISYMVATVTVINPGFYDPRFGYPVGNTRSTVLREFLMSFYNGELQELSTGLAKELLKNDKELYEEYRKLGKRRQKNELYQFIRRYNVKHPVYFLDKRD